MDPIRTAYGWQIARAMHPRHSDVMQVVEAPPVFPEDTRTWEHPFLAGVRAALDRQLAGVILDLERTVSLGPHGAAALIGTRAVRRVRGRCGPPAERARHFGPRTSRRGCRPRVLPPACRGGGRCPACRGQGPPAESENGDPHAVEREARRASGGVLRLVKPDPDAVQARACASPSAHGGAESPRPCTRAALLRRLPLRTVDDRAAATTRPA